MLDRKDKLIQDLRGKLRALKRYARSLKYLCEDWAPLGQPLPEILTMPPPVSLEDEEDDEYLRRQQSEIDKLKNRNRNLEEDIRRVGDRPMADQRGVQTSVYGGSQANTEVDRLRARIFELEKDLNKSKDSYSKRSSMKGDPEADKLRVYIKQMEDEVDKLKRMLQEQQQQQSRMKSGPMSMHSAGVQKVDDIQERILQELTYLKGNPDVLNKPGTGSVELDRLRKERDALIEENKKLKHLMNEDSAGPTSGNAKYLKNKIFHLEKTLAQLEKERSELSVRSTMAEEQLKNMQEHLGTTSHSYQKKIFDMKKILKSKGVDVSIF